MYSLWEVGFVITLKALDWFGVTSVEDADEVPLHGSFVLIVSVSELYIIVRVLGLCSLKYD